MPVTPGGPKTATTPADPTEASYGGEPTVSDDAEKKAEYAHDRYHVQDDSYTGYYREWTHALLFLLKKHWYKWDQKGMRWAPDKNVPRWRQRPVENLTYQVYRTAHAKLTKNRPTFDVVPASGDTDDRQAAKLAESILHQKWRELALSTVHSRAVGWLLATGSTFLRVHWNPEAGEVKPLTVPVTHPVTGEEVDAPADENGEPKMKPAPSTIDPGAAVEGTEGTDPGEQVPDLDAEPHQIAEGEVEVSLVSPFSIRFNPDAESPDQATEWFIGELWPVQKAATYFHVPAETLIPDAEENLSTPLDLLSSAASAQPNVDLGFGDKSEETGDRVLVLQYYRKPCQQYPEGRHWVQVNKVMVSEEEALPYGFWPPCVAVQDTPVPGQPFALGLLGQVVPLNDELNRTNARIREHQELMTRGGKWVRFQHDKHLNFTSDPGQVLDTKAPSKELAPYQIALSGLPSEVYAERDTIRQSAYAIAGTSENVVGSDAPGAPSGRSLLVQQEITNSVFEPSVLAFESGWSEVGRRILCLVREYYREERAIKARGQSGQWEFRAFSGMDLTDSMDVQVQQGSMFPWSKSAKLDLAMQMLQQMPGLTTNMATGEVDTMKLARYLDIGGLNAFTPEGDADMLEIERETAAFAAYQDGMDPATIDPQALLGFWQDHAKHAAGHRDTLKRDRGQFDSWHPLAQKNFLLHVQLTDQTLGQAVQAMQPPVPQGPPSGAPTDPTQQPPAAPMSAGGGASGPPMSGPSPDASLTPADMHDAGIQ